MCARMPYTLAQSMDEAATFLLRRPLESTTIGRHPLTQRTRTYILPTVTRKDIRRASIGDGVAKGTDDHHSGRRLVDKNPMNMFFSIHHSQFVPEASIYLVHIRHPPVSTF